MWAKDKQTLQFLERMGPTFHMSLYHHHNLARTYNQVEEPSDDELITFTWDDGSEYHIKYSKLKELATTEQTNFIQENDNQHNNNEGTE
jgi:hypothetical protein